MQSGTSPELGKLGSVSRRRIYLVLALVLVVKTFRALVHKLITCNQIAPPNHCPASLLSSIISAYHHRPINHYLHPSLSPTAAELLFAPSIPPPPSFLGRFTVGTSTSFCPLRTTPNQARTPQLPKRNIQVQDHISAHRLFQITPNITFICFLATVNVETR